MLRIARCCPVRRSGGCLLARHCLPPPFLTWRVAASSLMLPPPAPPGQASKLVLHPPLAWGTAPTRYIRLQVDGIYPLLGLTEPKLKSSQEIRDVSHHLTVVIRQAKPTFHSSSREYRRCSPSASSFLRMRWGWERRCR